MGKRNSKCVTISLQPDILEEVDRMAAELGLNRSQYISNLILKEIERQCSFTGILKSIFLK